MAPPPLNLTAAMNPLNWMPTVPLTNSGYPIVGYTTEDVSSCYANKTKGSVIAQFLTAQYQNTSLQSRQHGHRTDDGTAA